MALNTSYSVTINHENGGEEICRLPLGFRFFPTDEELLVHYLKPKLLSLPLPASVIPDHLDAFRTNPWDLPGDLRDRRYFFVRRKGNVNEDGRINAIFGYWKATSKDKPILVIGNGSSKRVVGTKKSLVFYEGKKGLRTCWIMHEYRLFSLLTIPNSTRKNLMVQIGDWVVCGIYHQKKRKPKRKQNVAKDVVKHGQSIVDFTIENSSDSDAGPPQPIPSCSCSSGITEDHSLNESAEQVEQEASSA